MISFKVGSFSDPSKLVEKSISQLEDDLKTRDRVGSIGRKKKKGNYTTIMHKKILSRVCCEHSPARGHSLQTLFPRFRDEEGLLHLEILGMWHKVRIEIRVVLE